MATTVNPDDFRIHATEVRTSAQSVTDYAVPDVAHVADVLESYGPVIGPVLAQGLADHYTDREKHGHTLAGRYNTTGDAFAQGRVLFTTSEATNRDNLTI